MKMVLVMLVMMVSTVSQASKLSCYSRSFEGQDKEVIVSAKVGSNFKLNTLNVEIDSDSAREGSVVYGRSYSGKLYQDMVLFSLDTKGVEIGIGWEDSRMSLLLPAGFSSQKTFKGVITSETSTEGKNNTVYCSIK